ncbi:hypothetical protein OG21DRAFT_219710 [Imleria badia]|nr:hypothetical protein OG21DRAFT_219710 [Imleria badia]
MLISISFTMLFLTDSKLPCLQCWCSCIHAHIYLFPYALIGCMLFHLQYWCPFICAYTYFFYCTLTACKLMCLQC